MKKLPITIILLCAYIFACSQNTVSGSFTKLASTKIKLVGYSGFNSYVIDSTQANNKGEFHLSFDQEDFGMAYLLSENNKSFVVLLADNEKLQMKGQNFELTESVEIINGKQNLIFDQYAKEHIRREQCQSAWDYLAKIYKNDTLFASQKAPKLAIETEIKRIKTEDELFLAELPESSYVKYYLPLRKLVSSVSTIAQYRTHEIPSAIEVFRNIDYLDPRLSKSGLLKDAIESHFWLIENSGRSLDSVYIEMEISIDSMLENLKADEEKLNEITEYLFSFLEQRSLFTASEYLAIKLLNEKSCTLNNDFAFQLESYRAMKKGNIAPEIIFTDAVFAASKAIGKNFKKLSDIQSSYKVVIFGASWCPQCPIELQEIVKRYEVWKQQGVEVVFVSLDDDKQTFVNFIKPLPFISTCDYKKWDSQPVNDYHVFATPTIYLLDNNHRILLKPNSVNHLSSWIDWYLIKGNKKRS
jgi:thiol-disulfide isomerase/thioredoxin